MDRWQAASGKRQTHKLSSLVVFTHLHHLYGLSEGRQGFAFSHGENFLFSAKIVQE